MNFFNLNSCSFKCFCCFLAKCVNTAMNICIHRCIIFINLINYISWFLSSCCIIKINKSFIVNFFLQNRKILTNLIYIIYFF